MALTQECIPATVARQAIAGLVREEMELPPVALVLKACREARYGDTFYDWRCPECGSDKVAGSVGGVAVCFDCDHEWEA